MHNPIIDWKKQIIKFNLANCIKKLFLCSVPYIEFAVRSKFKKIIESKELIAIDFKINIQPVNTEYFFRIVQKKRYKFFYKSYVLA